MKTNPTSYDLERFVEAQQPVYASVKAELTAGRKTSHWMWFIFPQIKGLGHSPTARHFALASRSEAVAYWRHPVLGARLKECTELMFAAEGKPAIDILGSPDDLKFKSSMTLFSLVAPEEPKFKRAIDQFFAGQADAKTVELMRGL